MSTTRFDGLVRLLSLAVMAISLTYIVTRANVRTDLTSEGLSRITDDTRELIRTVDPERPVVVTAYVTKDVPQGYVALRSRLVNILREMEASSSSGLTVRIFEPEPFSEEATQAIEKYGIAPRAVVSTEGGRVDTVPVFLGVAFTSGPREEVIPFFDRGLSVEYEVARALRVVTQKKKRVVGIMRTDAHLMGHFDIGTRRQIPAWRIVEELKKQYEVRSLNPSSPIAPDVEVVIVPQVSSLSNNGLNNLQAYLLAGKPALIIADPMPVFDIRLSPSEEMLPPPGQGGGMMGGGPPGEPKGDYEGFLRNIGVQWHSKRVVWDTDNPNPRFRGTPRHVLFVGDREDQKVFEGGDKIVDGLAQVVALFPGDLEPAESGDVQFEPLLVSTETSGFDDWDKMVDNSNFLLGLRGPIIPRQRGAMTDRTHVIGARIRSASTSEDGGGIDAIVLADLDLLADSFFAFHERGGDVDGDGLIDVRLDNVTFILNAIDTLVGDERFVSLRKRKPKFRRLERVDAQTETARTRREEQIVAANEEAEKKLQEAQANLEKAVAEIQARTGIDEQTKRIMARSVEETENRKLKQQQEGIEREKSRQVDKIEAEHIRAVDEVQNRIRLAAVLLPPIPAILMGLILFARKRRRESSSIPASRRKGAQTKSRPPSTATAKPKSPGPQAPRPEPERGQEPEEADESEKSSEPEKAEKAEKAEKETEGDDEGDEQKGEADA